MWGRKLVKFYLHRCLVILLAWHDQSASGHLLHLGNNFTWCEFRRLSNSRDRIWPRLCKPPWNCWIYSLLIVFKHTKSVQWPLFIIHRHFGLVNPYNLDSVNFYPSSDYIYARFGQLRNIYRPKISYNLTYPSLYYVFHNYMLF